MIPLGILGSAKVTAGGSSLTGTYVTTAVQDSAATTYTFTAADLGTPSASRNIVVGILGVASTTGVVSTVTIAGVAATLVCATGSQQYCAAFYSAAVPTGTAGDVVVTFSAGFARACISVWSVLGTISGTSTAVNTAPASTTIATTVTGATGGFICSVAYTTRTTGTPAWTNATSRYSLNSMSGYVGAADATTVGSTTISRIAGSGNMVMASVALAP